MYQMPFLTQLPSDLFMVYAFRQKRACVLPKYPAFLC